MTAPSLPSALRPGDLVQLVAPAGPFDRESFDRGLAVLQRRYTVRYADRIFERVRYLAGSDEGRLADLLAAWSDPDVKAVLCARGGYGVMRLLPSVPFAKLPNKPLIGFSDITALHLPLQKLDRVSFHSPVLTQLGRSPEHVVERLWQVLEQAEPAPALNGTETYFEGRAVEGRFVGGNLSVLTRLLGTPYMPDFRGAVLLLEDVGERPYRLDRMWTHLRLAGVFEQVRGVVLGEFTGCDEKDGGYGSADVLRELARETRVPCAAGFPIGHGEVNMPVPLGVRVRFDADARRLEFFEPAVRA